MAIPGDNKALDSHRISSSAGTDGEDPVVGAYLTTLGSATAVRWVFNSERMAFSDYTGKRISSRMSHGDRLYFYLSSSCWRDLGSPAGPGMLVADAVVLTDVKPLGKRTTISGRTYTYGCELLFEKLARLGTGVKLSDCSELDLLAGRTNYGQALQRTPILLSRHDSDLIGSKLAMVAGLFEEAVGEYVSEESSTVAKRGHKSERPAR